ncbi:MAG: symmetrical bis(5'-nucleosyl)-tetraphosphatase [Neisseria sp.]|nr:symmetrical bis(5'-nucleosyl)-tetraphosphatase [Neisseria sp.]
MTHYAIGDIQGCFDELQALLAKLAFNHGTDTLWLTGDIVNRGPKSLESLLFCMKHEDSVQIVLGNHDLHLLALLYGCGKIKRGDTLDGILNHPRAKHMRDWLRRQPLLRRQDAYLLVHAGLLPQWTAQTAQELAAEVEHKLRGHHAKHYFAEMYGNKPDAWSPQLHGQSRLRLITNVFTRMRALTADNRLDYAFKGGPADMPEGLHAWFDAPGRRHLDHTVVFGHWSALGFIDDKQVLALDTGALWGGCLTAVNLSGHGITQEASHRPPMRL